MQERWDVVMLVLNGPLSGPGEHVYRGPVVRIGAQPGPGGFALPGYRGLDARHATITAYEGGTAAVAPVGTNQVRMAPHANVNWQEIDPMSSPEYLSEGCAIHLGPVGRGVTLEFVQCRRLGVWSGGALASEVAGPGVAGGPGVAPGSPPAAFDARGDRRIRSSTVPAWFIGCMVMMTAVFVAVPLAVVFVNAISIERLGPVEEGEPFYRFATVSISEVNPKLKEGLNTPFYDFVVKPSIEVSGRRALEDPANWDTDFYDYVAASVETHLKAWNVFRRLDVVRQDYATVVGELRAADLPEVIGGMPYLESRYTSDLQSVACAKGYWQFMPEVAFRIDRDSRLSFKVQDCTFTDADADIRWSPTEPTPVKMVMQNAPYIDKERQNCRIKSCRVDERLDLKKSTAAAMFALGEAYADPDLRKSGAAVAITILSHNAGYDDSRFGRRKRSNLRDAYFGWKKGKPDDELPRFYGRNITTSDSHSASWNGSAIPSETQHYAYTIVAEHILAVCYYGLNYADEIPAFRDYKQYTQKEGYCRQLNIPTVAEVRKRKK